MRLEDISVLTYNSRLLGLRFFTDEGKYDADRATLRENGIYNINLKNQLELKEVGNLLLTEDEATTGEYAEDISKNPEMVAKFKELIEAKPEYHYILEYQKPYEVSIKLFLEDDGWTPVKVERNDEHRNQHKMLQPDGHFYRGGWVGKNRQTIRVKGIFHYEQVYWALHRGNDVAPEAVETYPDLKRRREKILEIQSTISIKEEDGSHILTILVEDEPKTFDIATYPIKDRISQREFVREHDLVSRGDISGVSIHADTKELTIIAINRAIHAYLKKPIKDPYYA